MKPFFSFAGLSQPSFSLLPQGAASPVLALDAGAAAHAIGISRRHFLSLVARGQLPQGLRLGRCVRWPICALAAALVPDAPPLVLKAIPPSFEVGKRVRGRPRKGGAK